MVDFSTSCVTDSMVYSSLHSDSLAENLENFHWLTHLNPNSALNTLKAGINFSTSPKCLLIVKFQGEFVE